jgi:hypothetical protein
MTAFTGMAQQDLPAEWQPFVFQYVPACRVMPILTHIKDNQPLTLSNGWPPSQIPA